MKSALLRRRLANQALARTSFRRAEDVVAWFGALQAQDYLGALWAIGQRLRRATEADVEAAETRRAILRTWPMRGTLHFVAAADARWMTQLLAPRVIARNVARWKREFDLDARTLGRCREVVTGALGGGKRLTRTELYASLEARRIRTGASRGLHALLWLAMDGTLCLAGRAGKQHTFALLDDWLAPSPAFDRDAALGQLATRYFTSHGPATRADLMWWAGITARDATSAIECAAATIACETLDGQCWYEGALARRSSAKPTSDVRLLPAYDEYTVGYADRTLLVEDSRRAAGMQLLNPVLVIDGAVAGTWKRVLGTSHTRIDVAAWRRLSTAESLALERAAERFGAFVGRDVRLHARFSAGATSRRSPRAS